MAIKCPACKTNIISVVSEPIKIQKAKHRTPLNGVSYVCPECRTLLSVGADLIALQADIVSALTRELRTWK